MRSRRQDSFKTFEENTSDAWDDGDDDLMKSASAARQKLPKKNIKSVCDALSNDGINLSARSNDSANVNSSLSEQSAPVVSSSGMNLNISFLLPTAKRNST